MVFHGPASSTPQPTGLLIGAGFAVVVAACALSAAVVSPVQVEVRFAVVGLAACIYAIYAAQVLSAAVTGLLAWLLATGFLVGDPGELAMTGGADVRRLLALVAIATAGGLYGVVRRRRRLVLDRRDPVEQCE
ncbi:hypothetical protein OIE66_16730 [Nonomuraea sp. NBC_01738]|uniref:hypothetical protein n=1 Tax=Nonomuraea sp. NBC_01738 TaxID=2976003 RepID=UPI002E15FF62|nr:hypothetical protein OIE66_16730 [Nonomuraea sp. NBC_01738]